MNESGECIGCGAPLPPRARKWCTRELWIMEQAWDDGLMAALLDAHAFCKQWEVPLPTWAGEGFAKCLATLLDLQDYERRDGDRGPRKGQGGRHSDWRTQLKQNYVHWVRWDAIDQLHKQSDSSRPRLSLVKASKKVHELLKEINDDARGEPAAILDSYHLVQNAYKRGCGARFSYAGSRRVK